MVGTRVGRAAALAAVLLTAGCGVTVKVPGPQAAVTTKQPPSPAQLAAARLVKELLPASAAPGYKTDKRWDSAHPPTDLPKPTVSGGAACAALYKSFLLGTAGQETASAYAAQAIVDQSKGDGLSEWVGAFDDTTAKRVMTQVTAEAKGCHAMTITEGGSSLSLTVRPLFADETPAFGASTVAVTLTSKSTDIVTVIGRFGDTVASYSVTQPALADAEVAARQFGPQLAARVSG